MRTLLVFLFSVELSELARHVIFLSISFKSANTVFNRFERRKVLLNEKILDSFYL